MRVALVERMREIEELTLSIARTQRNEGGVALIEGAPGVGKTHLLSEVRRRALAEGLLVAGGRGSRLERLFSFGVVRQLFEGHLADPAVRRRALAGPAIGAEAVFTSEIAAAGEEPAADVSFTTLHALYWLTLNLAEAQPLVLAVDDLQWCDRESLRFLAYLAARVEGQPVLLATTLRTDHAGAESGFIGEIVQAPAVTLLQPGPLSSAAVAELVRERLGPGAEPGFCDACHVATGGNPLLLSQLISGLKGGAVAPTDANATVVQDVGPQAIVRTVSLQLSRLPEAATAVARAVAVLGDGAELTTIASFTGLDDASVAEAAGTLARADILTARTPLRFVHPLVRDAVYDQLSVTERELEHARAAQVMIDAGAPDEQISAHLISMPRAGQQWVVDRLVRSARSAVGMGSPESAISYLSRALEEPAPEAQRPQLLLELGLAEALTSGPNAVEHLSDALASATDPVVLATAAPVLAQSTIFTGDPREAAAFARATAERLPEQMVDEREILEAIELGTTLFGVAEPDMLRRLVEYRERPVGAGPGAKMLGALTAWEWAMTGGDWQTCAQLSRDALADDTMVAADNGFLTVPAIGVLFLSDLDEAVSRWDALLADSYRSGSLFAVSCVHLWSGITAIRRGELADAEQLVREGFHELQLWGVQLVDGAYFSSALALARLEQGDLAGARRGLGSRPDPSYRAFDAAQLWMRSEVEVLLAEGRNEEARAAAQDYGDAVGRLVNPAWVPWRSLQALALDRLGRSEEALGLVEEELVHARAWGAPGTVGRTLRIRGMLRRDQGLGDLEESVAILLGTPAQLELAKSYAALGTALRLAGRPTDAREPLRAGLQRAELCGAAGLVKDIRTELYAAGSRPQHAESSGPGALTASEQRVATLAVTGMTNREIAQQLFVTPKTVEVHLSATYRKLGIASRRELSQWLTPV
jgi:DNA-binding CsgD family transcriptional regulator